MGGLRKVHGNLANLELQRQPGRKQQVFSVFTTQLVVGNHSLFLFCLTCLKHFLGFLLAPGATQRKPRARTPKAEKPKTEEADGVKEEPAKGRRRKRPAKAEATPAPDPTGKAEAATEEMDPIMATIEAVLAKAAAMDTSAFKKAKRTKKQQQQQGDAQKPDGEKSTADDLENDDDSSTAGNEVVGGGIGMWCGVMQLYDRVIPIVLCVFFLNR